MAWNLEVGPKLRPCYWKTYLKSSRKFKALFHQFITIQQPIEGGLTIGSAPAGQLSMVYALIELEDGTLRYVSPYEITFLDNPFTDYAWPEEEKEEN